MHKLLTKIENITNYKFKILLIAVAAVRVGISPIGKEWFGWLSDAAQAFPEATSYISYSPLPVLILRVIGTENPFVWWFLWLAVYITWIFLCLTLIEKRYKDYSRPLQIIFIMSQMVALNFTMIGHYDNLIMIATSIAIFSNSRKMLILSALIAAGANAYISFASGVCLLFLYLATHKRKHYQLFLYYIGISTTILIFTHLYQTPPESGTRESIVLGMFSIVLKGVVGIWWFIPLTVFGPLTFIILYLISQRIYSFGAITNIQRLCILISIILIPIAMSYLIFDHTRLGVSTGSIAMLIFIFEEYEIFYKWLKDKNFSGELFLFVLFLITPPLIVDSGGSFRLPYLKYLLEIMPG